MSSIASKTTPDSATAGAPTEAPATVEPHPAAATARPIPRPSEPRRQAEPAAAAPRQRAWPLVNALTSKLVLLAAVIAAVPLILYDHFQQAYDDSQALLMTGVREQGRLLARSIQPLLEDAPNIAPAAFNATLERLVGDSGATVRVLFRPAGAEDDKAFFYVAATPAVTTAFLENERHELRRLGVLGRLAPSCDFGMDSAIRYETAAGASEVLTSISPLTTSAGCWAVITSHSAGAYRDNRIGTPYWQTSEVRLAAASYGLMAVVIFSLFVAIWRSLRRFGRQAHHLRYAHDAPPSFAAQNRVPELSGVAAEFDRMVVALQSSARGIREAAEDNAHAFKTPIAVIRQCVEPLGRALPRGDQRGHRALEMIGQALDRLDGLVSFARRMDETEADLIDPPRARLDLSTTLAQLLGAYEESFTARGVALERRLDPDVFVLADDELLETVAENLMENALSFTPDGGRVHVALRRRGGQARLSIEDSGPGVPPERLPRIFERYHSDRGQAVNAGGFGDSGLGHMGIGLWIVARNVEAIGGTVRAENRSEGGLRVIVALPIAGRVVNAG